MIRAWLTRLLLGGVLTASLLAVALLAGLAPAAEAAPPPATIAVTSCPANQAALQNLLNQAGSESPAVIQFTSTASNCQLNLSSTLTIGAGVDITIDGNGLTLIGDRTSSTPGTFNMILINDSPDNISKLALSDMTVKDGGSGIGDLSGVASVTVTDSTITGNDAANGILVGQVTVTNSTVSDNGGSGAGAGIGAVFGATVINSTVSDNGGDGVATGEGATAKATVMNSTIEHNNGNGVNSPTVDVSNSTVNDNQKTGIVGDTTTVTSSTVSGNVVNGIAGVNSATVSNSTVVDSGRFGVGGTGTITVESSTISGSNVAGVYGENGATLTATILTANATDCAVTGALTDGGYNLLASPDGSDNSCVFTGGTHGSLAVTDAQLHLLPLGNYGGPTQTIALDSGSKAIDFVPLNNGGHCSVGAQQTDQRGVPRPQGSGCDAGAFERTTTLVSLTCQQSPAQAAYTQGGQSWYAENVTESCPLIDDAASIYDTVSLTTKVAAGQASAAAPLGLASPACSGESCGQLTLSDTQACLTSDA
ncbi:MAG TPA: right-handed parallel beta-helix repeat-containing protein, partial [Thermomicrobiaceae bacterium]|nr:right-handed parallel beta-helix repeat-containing protein [Thermomicrobiaceae bacterium]